MSDFDDLNSKVQKHKKGQSSLTALLKNKY